ncbi:MAG TPA: globin [Thioalkalivibrio sp.]|nr:globin [Thioalkalivibrio sp.]
MSNHTASATPYAEIGGELGVRRLVDRFYDLMDTSPEVSPLRQMHARSLRGSRRKLFLYLSEWLGGPAIYSERYGHPRLHRRHLPFSISQAERDQWMWCMDRALNEAPMPDSLREQLRDSIAHLADHMRNQGEAPDGCLACAGGVGCEV